jgi:hypothetical protein
MRPPSADCGHHRPEIRLQGPVDAAFLLLVGCPCVAGPAGHRHPVPRSNQGPGYAVTRPQARELTQTPEPGTAWFVCLPVRLR